LLLSAHSRSPAANATSDRPSASQSRPGDQRAIVNSATTVATSIRSKVGNSSDSTVASGIQASTVAAPTAPTASTDATTSSSTPLGSRATRSRSSRPKKATAHG
jgi:hypothetical protein